MRAPHDLDRGPLCDDCWFAMTMGHGARGGSHPGPCWRCKERKRAGRLFLLAMLCLFAAAYVPLALFIILKGGLR